MNNPTSLINKRQRKLLHQQLVLLIESLGVPPKKLAHIMHVIGRGIKRHDFKHNTKYFQAIRGNSLRLPNEEVIAILIPRWIEGSILPNWEHLVLLKILADGLGIPLIVPEGAAPERYLTQKYQLANLGDPTASERAGGKARRNARLLLHQLWLWGHCRRVDKP